MLKTIAVEGDQQPRYPRKRLIDLAPPMAMKLRLMFMGSHSFLKQNSITFDRRTFFSWRNAGIRRNTDI
jgi:hypothetical protein